MEYCNCGKLAGFVLVNGELVCQECGGLSPTSKLVGEKFVRIGEKQTVCPKCGTIIQEDKKLGSELEDKMAAAPENKRVVPHGVKKLGRPKGR